MEWNELMPHLKKNINYWSNHVYSKLCNPREIEREDIYQELLLVLWKKYCYNMKNGKDVSVWYMQKALQHASYRILKKVYTKKIIVEEYVDSYYYDYPQRKIFYSDFVNQIFDELKNNLMNDEEIKVLDILTMLLEGRKNEEIRTELNMKASTLSNIIKRKIKDQLKIILKQEENFSQNCEKIYF